MSLTKFLLGVVILFVILMFFIFIYSHTLPRADTAATKAIYSKTFKYISEEIQGCALGKTTIMDGNLTCSELSAANVVAATAKTLTVDRNYYDVRNNAVRISTSSTKDKDAGYINLSASGSDVVVKSCHTKPCSDEDNRISKTIEIK